MSKKKRMKNKMTKADRRKMMRRRRRKRIAVLIAEVLVLSVLCVIAYGIFKINKMDFNIINQEKLEVYKDKTALCLQTYITAPDRGNI